jgi:hypothetical protein
VSKAYSNLKDLLPQLSNCLDQINSDTFSGDPDDLVDALALPIFMIDDALGNMDQIVQVADEIDKEKQMAIIFAFLTAIFIFVPMAGEVAGTIGALAGIARIASLLGVLGNTALDIYTIVDDPNNAPLAIFSLITGPMALGDVATMAKAAKARRDMSSDQVGKLGKGISDRMESIDKIRGVCLLKRSMVIPSSIEPWPMSVLDSQTIHGYVG